MEGMWKRAALATAMALTMMGGVQDASAFCGTYVSGGGADLFNSATQVVLMRDGTKTVLSMQNNYKGPAEDFAMIVPVPVVLMQDQVKTLSPELFSKLDTYTAPRVVEYAEKDPCKDRYNVQTKHVNGCPWRGQYDDFSNNQPSFDMSNGPMVADQGGTPPPVVVEAQFEVGEYEVVVLSSEEATGLETWLQTNNYQIPAGATDLFNQYIQQGMYFFVARVNADKVTFDAQGNAVLSPLRFDYDSESFSLPIRLGLVNSAGQQDVIIHILSLEGRFEVANYPNAFIPTNVRVTQNAKADFGTFYQKQFARTLADNPGAVVTEYAWGFKSPVKCDPCPEGFTPSFPPLDWTELATLGTDVIDAQDEDPNQGEDLFGPGFRKWGDVHITRLHARYGKTEASEDLIFRKVEAAKGGVGTSGVDQVTQATVEGEVSQFQARYISHIPWGAPVTCEDAVRGRWIGTGAPGAAPGPTTTSQNSDLSGAALETLLDTSALPPTGTPKDKIEVIDLGPCNEPAPEWYDGPEPAPYQPVNDMGEPITGDIGGRNPGSCGASVAGGAAPVGAPLLLLLFGFLWRRRRATA